jgi:hypothetical protein
VCGAARVDLGEIRAMNDTLQSKLDFVLGAGGVTHPVWLPELAQVDWLAAKVSLWGGAVLVALRVGAWLRRRYRSWRA